MPSASVSTRRILPTFSGCRLGRANETPSSPESARTIPARIALARRLYPFRRRAPSRTMFTLDEQATVDRIAEGDAWSLVLRPVPVRFLHLTLVIDSSPSMWLWQRNAEELLRILN